MKADTLIKEVQARKTATARKIAASSSPLIAPDVRRAMIKHAAKLTLKKMAGRSPQEKLAAVAAIIAVGLGQKKIAGDFNSLKAELGACKLIGQFERSRSKEASLFRSARRVLGGALVGSGVTAGVMGRNSISNFGSQVGSRMTNAYNSLFNPSAVMNQQQLANIGIGGQPQTPAMRAAPSAPTQNPFDSDFNTMTMADFAKHRAALQQRMMSMDQAYPGFAPQQPQQPVFNVQPTPAQPKLTYNPNGNIPRYYGLG